MKKVLALVLAATMALGMATTVFAAGTPKIKDFAGGMTLGHSNGGQTWNYTKDIVPYDKIKSKIRLTTGMFAWEDNDSAVSAPAGDKLLSSSQIRSGKLGVRTSVSAGSKAIDSVKIVSKDSVIEVKYVEAYVATKELDFDFTVYLTIDGKRKDDAGMNFIGTLANPITEVFDGDDYVDTSSGQIAHAQDYIADAEVDLGNGVKIFTKLFKDKKYYGTASRDPQSADDAVFAKYPDVDGVVTLSTIGLNASGNIVQLDNDSYSDYYVYDKDLNYLGKSSQMLPYSTKYYLATAELNIADDEETGDAPEVDDGDIENPEGGGDDGIENSNANPSTGC